MQFPMVGIGIVRKIIFMTKYDIYLCTVPYTEQDGTIVNKNRPVVIIDNNTAVDIGAQITHVGPRLYDPGDYPIEYWKEAGLKMPSTIRLAHTLIINSNNIIHKIGHLSKFDIENIEIMLRNI